MTLYDFTAMSEEQQAEILRERGVYLMGRQECEHKFAQAQILCRDVGPHLLSTGK